MSKFWIGVIAALLVALGGTYFMWDRAASQRDQALENVKKLERIGEINRGTIATLNTKIRQTQAEAAQTADLLDQIERSEVDNEDILGGVFDTIDRLQ